MGYRDFDASEVVAFSDLVGKTLKSVQNNNDDIVFETTEGERFRQIYYDDCCANCSVEEIHGDLEDLVGNPILMAEAVSSGDPDESLIATRKAAYEKAKAEWLGDPEDFYYYGATPESGWKGESETWTFYKIATIKGSVTIRWYGSSNGYYSETPTFEKLNGGNES